LQESEQFDKNIVPEPPPHEIGGSSPKWRLKLATPALVPEWHGPGMAFAKLTLETVHPAFHRAELTVGH